MSRKIAFLALAFAAALPLAACSSSGGGSQSKFCTEAKAAYANRDSIFPREATDSPNFDQAIAQAKKLQKVAPDAIKKDYDTLVTALEDYKAGRLEAAINNSAKIEAAARRIFEYLQDTCKIEITTPSSSTPAPSTASK